MEMSNALPHVWWISGPTSMAVAVDGERRMTTKHGAIPPARHFSLRGVTTLCPESLRVHSYYLASTEARP